MSNEKKPHQQNFFQGLLVDTKELHYFKFVSALIDSGLWAQMSGAARALYPVLLRFSDRNYCHVWPGTQKLLKLTGFKQKASLRKARQELIDLGLVSVTRGTGRQNTVYHFRFEWVTERPPSGSSSGPAGDYASTPQREGRAGLEGVPATPQYNQIHISINNTQSTETGEANENENWTMLTKQFGERAVELARSECKLGGIEPSEASVRKILYRGESQQRESWTDVQEFLANRISPGSLKLIQDALIEQRDGILVFQNEMPEYLKQLLRRFDLRLYFEPASNSRLDFWRKAGTRL